LLLLRGAMRKVAERIQAGDITAGDALTMARVVAESDALAQRMTWRRDVRAAREAGRR